MNVKGFLYGIFLSGAIAGSAHAFDFCDEASVSPANPSDCRQWAKMACNVECAKCSTVNVSIPQNYTVVSWKAEVKDEQNPGWTETPENIGWSAWERKTGVFQPNGTFNATATLKNGSGDRSRQIRVCVTTK